MTQPLLNAAKLVVVRWEQGDLAAAVRELNAAIQDAKQQRTGELYVAVHEDKHGAEVHWFRWNGEHEPTDYDWYSEQWLAEQLGIEFKPQRGESLAIYGPPAATPMSLSPPPRQPAD